MNSPAEFISIEIKFPKGERYKSIGNLIWEAIPKFAILTGRNGSGKTQLLELLAYQLTETTHQAISALTLTVAVAGDKFGPDEIAYVPDSGAFVAGARVTVAQMQEIKRQVFGQVQHPHQVQRSIEMRARRQRLVKLLGKDLSALTADQFAKELPDDLIFMLEDNNVVNGLAHVFLAHRLRIIEELEKRTSEAEIKSKLGPAPWDVLNETLGVADFPYRVVSPIGSSLLDPYNFELKDQTSGQSIQPADLSSGEKVLLQLVLWLYNSKHHNRFPRLFLLDEPDAHLHPSMTRQFMDVIQEVLVGRYGVRVLMTTHSPSTVALAPEGSIFEMTRGAPKILPSKSKADTVGLLTAGLVVVSPTTRFALVEDEADVNFYSTVRDILSDYGPSKDAMALDPAPSIIFLPASLGKGPAKIGGGKSAVTQWIERLNTPPFDELVRGVIDQDSGNVATSRILTVKRHSIENYLVDPIVVLGLLIESGKNQSLPDISISAGDEHLIRALSPIKLQSVVDHVRSQVEPKLPNLTAAEKLTQQVEFTNGLELQYPNWMISYRGHDLLAAFQSTFSPQMMTPPRLLKSLQRVRLIPKDLAELLGKLQRG